jgi:DNA modification methylase
MTDCALSDIRLIHGDCLKVLPTLADGSVDMILTDLPYGCLNKGNKHAQWDNEIALDALWPELLRVSKQNAAIVLFGQGLFSAKLMMSRPDLYRYSLVWDKINRPTGFLDANRKPLRIHEDIIVFYRTQPIYNPQMSIGNKVHSRGKVGNGTVFGKNGCYGSFKQTEPVITNEKYPNSILSFAKEHGKYLHQTQNPVSLLEYLIKTYTNEGDCVLDATMGSGSTMVACANANRKGVGIELTEEYYNIAVERVKASTAQMKFDL